MNGMMNGMTNRWMGEWMDGTGRIHSIRMLQEHGTRDDES